MNKDIVLYTDKGIFFSHKKGNLAICNTVGDPQRHYTKYNSLVIGKILHNTSLHEVSIRVKYAEAESIVVVVRD